MAWHRLSDSLSWSPGHRGRGYLLHDGTIKTWNEDPYEPVDQHQVWQLNHELSAIALNFEIDPDGGVITAAPTIKVESILQADQRLYDAGQREEAFELPNQQPQQEKNGPDFNFVMSSETLFPIPMNQGCPRCHSRRVDDETGECLDCGYTIPYDGWEQMQGHDELGPVPGWKATGWGPGGALDDDDVLRSDLGEPHYGMGSPSRTSHWHFADGPYGYTNWDTSTVALTMDNDSALSEASRKLVERGGTPEQLRDWAVRKIIGPHNKQQIKDAQEWNEIPLEERKQRKRDSDISQFGEDAVNIGESLMQPFNEWNNEGKSEEEIRRDEEYDEPDLIDPEMVNWQELHQGILDEFEENAAHDREAQQAKDMGLGWATRGGNDDDKLRDAFYRYQGALPEEEIQAERGPGYHGEDPRHYFNRRINIPFEDLRQLPNWLENYARDAYGEVSTQRFNRAWEQLVDKFYREQRIPFGSREEAEQWLDERMKGFMAPWHLLNEFYPGGKRDNSAAPIPGTPEEEAIVISHPSVQQLQQNGYDMRLNEVYNDLSHAIRFGQPHPYTQQMGDALQQRGYSPQAIQQLMRQRNQWDPETNQIINLEPPAPKQPNPSLDQPSNFYPPQEWTSSNRWEGFGPSKQAIQPHPHFTTGQPCYCSFGSLPRSFSKTASKIQWLIERADKFSQTYEGKRALGFLQIQVDRNPKLDPLTPWLYREVKKGRITVGGNTFFIQGGDGRPLQQITPPLLDHWADWFESRSPTRRGLDVMQTDAADVFDRVQQWDEELKRQMAEARAKEGSGQIVHRFDDDWTVRRLRDAEEARDEGNQMGHCVGSYGHAIEQGDSQIFSLRDPQNEPHATMEIRPPRSSVEPYQMEIPEHVWNEVPSHMGVPINHLALLHDMDQNYQRGQREAPPASPEELKALDDFRMTYGHVPIEGGEVVQTQGKSNAAPHQEYTERLDEWLAPHDLQSYKPWWDEYYTQEGPETFEELLGHAGEYGEDVFGYQYPADRYYEYEPEDYRAAMADAEEHGVDEPDLYYTPPNYEKILESLINPASVRRWVPDPDNPGRNKIVNTPPWHGYNHEAGQWLYNYAAQDHDVVDPYSGRPHFRPGEEEGEGPAWQRYQKANHLEALHDALKEHMSDVEPWTGSEADFMHIEDPFARQRAMQQAQETYHADMGYDRDPRIQMYNHLGPMLDLDPGLQPYGQINYPTLHPQQQQLWDAEGSPQTQGQVYAAVMPVSPATELREWLADLGGSDEQPISLHHQSEDDLVQAPAVSTADDLPYYPPDHVPSEIKQSAWQVNPEEFRNLDYSTPTSGSKTPKWAFDQRELREREPGQFETLHDLSQYPDSWRFHEVLGKGWESEDWGPFRRDLISPIKANQPITVHRIARHGEGPILPGAYVTESPEYARSHAAAQYEYQGEPYDWHSLNVRPSELMIYGDPHEFIYLPEDPHEAYERYQRALQQAPQGDRTGATKTADSPITQADATNDPLGKPPAIIPSRQGDPDYLEVVPCPNCKQEHRPDEPCPDSSVNQWKAEQRSWYNRDPNAFHGAPDGLTEGDNGKLAAVTAGVDPAQDSLEPETEAARIAAVPTLGASVHADLEKVATLKEKYADGFNQPGHQPWFKPNPNFDPTNPKHFERFPMGRGFVHDPTGTVHTWPEPEGSHADMIAAKGFDSKDCCRFTLQPNGEVFEIAGPSSKFMDIVNADPRLAEPNGMPKAASWAEDDSGDELDEVKEAITGLAQKVAKIEPLQQHPEKKPRRLVFNRDEAGRLVSIDEEV